MKKQDIANQNARFIDEKLKAQSLMFFVSFFSCDLQDFKFLYVNRKAFVASFLYWVDFTVYADVDWMGGKEKVQTYADVI